MPASLAAMPHMNAIEPSVQMKTSFTNVQDVAPNETEGFKRALPHRSLF
jgi:hypothetical protein